MFWPKAEVKGYSLVVIGNFEPAGMVNIDILPSTRCNLINTTLYNHN